MPVAPAASLHHAGPALLQLHSPTGVRSGDEAIRSGDETRSGDGTWLRSPSESKNGFVSSSSYRGALSRSCSSSRACLISHVELVISLPSPTRQRERSSIRCSASSPRGCSPRQSTNRPQRMMPMLMAYSTSSYVSWCSASFITTLPLMAPLMIMKPSKTVIMYSASKERSPTASM
eukprot:scaffold82449_cov64-Phaeocystis_antarctica.AAC.4